MLELRPFLMLENHLQNWRPLLKIGDLQEIVGHPPCRDVLATNSGSVKGLMDIKSGNERILKLELRL